MRNFIAIILFLLLSVDATAACRSSSVKHKFDTLHGYPKGRPSLPGEELWIVDHVCALKCGGRDSIANLQYQSLSESKAKDRWETTPEGCKKTCNSANSTPYRTVFNCK